MSKFYPIQYCSTCNFCPIIVKHSFIQEGVSLAEQYFSVSLIGFLLATLVKILSLIFHSSMSFPKWKNDISNAHQIYQSHIRITSSNDLTCHYSRLYNKHICMILKHIHVWKLQKVSVAYVVLQKLNV